MRILNWTVCTICVLMLTLGVAVARDAALPVSSQDHQQISNLDDLEDLDNIVLDTGAFFMNIAGQGSYGNVYPTRPSAFIDPCTDEWAPAAQFPMDGGAQYLFRAGIWVGAIIHEQGFEYPRVSVATEGWAGDDEFLKDEDVTAVSNVDDFDHCLGDIPYEPDNLAPFTVISVFSDTATVNEIGQTIDHPTDGPHVPLGLSITQRVSAFDAASLNKIAVIEYTIENVGENTLHDLYLGLYTDADVGSTDQSPNFYVDDVNGFNTDQGYAYFLDGDGRPVGEADGNGFNAAHGIGVVALDNELNPSVQLSYNWWWPNGDLTYDFGPAWEDDNSPGNWTSVYGTPVTDTAKYFLMSNGEIDYASFRAHDADWVASHPQQVDDVEMAWKSPEDDALWPNFPQVFDVRALISAGPFGTSDGQGNRVFAPGDVTTIAFAYFFGADVHDPDNPQPNNQQVDPSLYDFTDMDDVASHARALLSQLGVEQDQPGDAPRVTDERIALSVHPNPSNAATTVQFTLSAPQQAELEVFNLLGQRVLHRAAAPYAAGVNTLTLDLGGLGSGVYLVHVTAGRQVATAKAIVLK